MVALVMLCAIAPAIAAIVSTSVNKVFFIMFGILG